jgi:zinc protease
VSTVNQAEDFRSKPPAPLTQRPLNLPEPKQATLANGLELVVVEDRRLPLVSIRLAVRSGTANDPRELPGLATMMTNLLAEGTATRTSRQIADEVARLGATLTAGANSDFTTVAASALSQYLPEIFDLVADISLRPSFPEAELNLARDNVKQALIQQRAQPSFLASEQVSRALFGEHPYAVISPTEASVDAMTRLRIVDFHSAVFSPKRAVLLAVGDVSFDDVRRSAEELFGDWKAESSPQAAFASLPENTTRRAFIVDRPGSEQSNIVIANRAIKRTDSDFFPMLLLHTILGANASSRLFMNLREEKGYTYGAYSTLDTRIFAGSFRASAEVRTPVTGASLSEFFYELERIRNDDVSEKELADAKAYLSGVFPIRLETQEGLTDQLLQQRMFGLPHDYLNTYRQNVEAITATDIRHAAAKYVLPDQAVIVLVGDARAILDDVSKFTNNIEVFDSHGKPKTLSDSADEQSVNIAGEWELELALPTGQAVPGKLVVEKSGGQLTGQVETQFGDAALSQIAIDGINLQAQISLSLMGQNAKGEIGAVVEGSEMQGSINLAEFPQIHFRGRRR